MIGKAAMQNDPAKNPAPEAAPDPAQPAPETSNEKGKEYWRLYNKRAALTSDDIAAVANECALEVLPPGQMMERKDAQLAAKLAFIRGLNLGLSYT